MQPNSTLPNDSAFPAVTAPVVEVAPGLTIREYMATAAMSGLLIARPVATANEIAVEAVEHADALIKALNETK